MRAIVRLVILLAVLGGAAFAYAWRSPIAPVERPPASAFPPAVVALGAQMAAIGNCVTCHTREGGLPYAGGRAIATPLPEPDSPPSSPHGLQCTRSICELKRIGWRACTTCSVPSPPRNMPAPPESWRRQ